MMQNTLARFPDAGSFVAGLMIGFAILMSVFAMIVAEPDDWQALWILGTLILLGLGSSLQVAVRATSGRPRTRLPEPGALRIRLGLKP